MNRLWIVANVMSLVVLFAVARPVWAVDEPQPSYQPLYEPSLQQPVSSSSGNIIGYQPIPNSALPDVTSAPAAPAQGPVAGGVSSPAQPTTQPPTTYDYTMWLVGEGPYTLGREDVIQVQVRHQPEFSGNFVVGPDGAIQYSHLGDIPVAGMTKDELEQVLAKLLERYVRVPSVTVIILAYNSKAVYVVGEVARPGKYIMRGDMIKLREAIIAAGLPTPNAALWRTHVIQPSLEDPRVRRVNLKTILYKGKLKDDIDLYPGEIVVVPSTVLSAANRFLSQLLSPVTRVGAAVALGAL